MTMAETLADQGLVEVFAILANSGGDPEKDGVPLTRLAWYDPETKMFFTRDEGVPIGTDPEESARNLMPVVAAHPDLSATPFSDRDDPRLTDLAVATSLVWHEARRWDLEADDEDVARKAPEYINAYCHPWCAIIAQEASRYRHVYGLVIYWSIEAPTVMVHSWLYDTHQKVSVECNPNVPEGAATYVGTFAPKDLLRPDLRGHKGLANLRLFYAGLPRP